MEYYFQTTLGLVAITPREGLPSAVELRLSGKILAAYLSAEDAARAVASSSTGHYQLDTLPCYCVPALLSDWKQSLPHHFTGSGLKSEERAQNQNAGEELHTEMLLAI